MAAWPTSIEGLFCFSQRSFFFSIWLGKAHDLEIFILLFFLIYYQYQTWWHLFESVNTCAKCKYDNKSMTAARSLMYGKIMAAIDLLILVLFYYCQFIPRLTCPTQKKKKVNDITNLWFPILVQSINIFPKFVNFLCFLLSMPELVKNS